MSLKVWNLAVLLTLFGLNPASALAYTGVLPPYCDQAFKASGQATAMLQQLFGPGPSSSHHYCSGLDNLNRYYTAKTNDGKQYALVHAVAEFSHVMRALEPKGNVPILAEVYFNRGLAQSLGKHDSEAMRDWYRALELNPKLDQAYFQLAQYFHKLGQDAKAMELATQGLRHAPGKKGLQSLYKELGGKLPYPEPIEPARAAVKENQQAPAASGQVTQDEPGKADKSPAEVPMVQPVRPAAVPIERPPIGTPQNPYCRFCPDPGDKPVTGGK